MKLTDFLEALSAALLVGMIFIILFASIKRNPTKGSDAEPKTAHYDVWSEPKAEYSEPFIFDEAKQEQKLTSSKKRKNRYGIQSAAKKRGFKN